jgi:glycosyltransferase involved in cell wall biosynthesis
VSVHFSIDSIAVRDARLFGWGWVLDPDRTIATCELDVPLADGRRWSFAGLFQGRREDVAAAFPGVAHAAAAGFALRGAAPAAIAPGTAIFRVRYEDGGLREWSLDGFPDAFATGGPRTDLQRFLGAVRTRGWIGALRQAARALQLRAAGWWEALRAAVDRLQTPLRDPVVVFDHAMGGGANRARERLVREHLAAGRTVAVVTPVLAELAYRLEVRNADRSWAIQDSELDTVLGRLQRARPARIEVNDLVTFGDVAGILEWCLARQAEGSTLRYHLHDFHSACPAFTLVDRQDRFCGIPDYATCAACLPANHVHTLGFHQHVALPEWRARWQAFLERVDGIVAFSGDSVRWLERAFPALRLDHVSMHVQSPVAAPLRRVRPPDRCGPLVVAAIGHLSVPKGAAMLRTLAERAAARGLPLRFVVVGTTDRPGAGVHVTGPFSRERLPDLLEGLGVGACLLPSICPETYSFVTDEMMQTGLPVAVFDVGAPPERVRAYPAGLVLPLQPDAALDGMMRAWFAAPATVARDS